MSDRSRTESGDPGSASELIQFLDLALRAVTFPLARAAATATATAAELAAIAVEILAAPTAELTTLLGPGFVGSQRTSIEDLAVESLDSSFQVSFGSQFDEAEAARPAGIHVAHDFHTGGRYIQPGYQLAEFRVRHVIR